MGCVVVYGGSVSRILKVPFYGLYVIGPLQKYCLAGKLIVQPAHFKPIPYLVTSTFEAIGLLDPLSITKIHGERNTG